MKKEEVPQTIQKNQKIVIKQRSEVSTPTIVQPQIVQKPSEESKPEPPAPTQVKILSNPINFIGDRPNNQLNSRLQEYLMEENSDFLVVSCVGAKNSGKSTVMSLLAEKDGLFCGQKSELEGE